MSNSNLLSLDKKNSTNVRLISLTNKLQERMLELGFGILEQASPELAARAAARLFSTPRRHNRPLRERSLLKKAESWSIDWRGEKLALWSWGEGPAILLVHGWEGRGAQLGSFIPKLTEAGYRVVAFDGPGHGDSGGQLSSVVELADAIRAVSDSIGGVHGIIAHSMGGAATSYALKCGLKVERAVFIAPPSELSAFARRFCAYLGLSAKIGELMRERIEDRLKVKMSELSVGAIAETMNVPLLVIHDEDDKEVFLKDGYAIANAWPGARLIITSGMGHRRILHDAEVISEAVAFIDERAREPRAEAWQLRLADYYAFADFGF